MFATGRVGSNSSRPTGEPILFGTIALTRMLCGASCTAMRAREIGDRGLGGRIGDGARTALPARGRADVDDLAAAALRDHLLRDVLRHQELALERDRHHPVPVLLGAFEDGLVVGDRDVVDQDVDAAEAADHRLDHRGDVGALRHVGHVKLGVAARGLDRVDGALAARPVEVDDRDLGALGGEQLGDLLADIAAGAGDDRDLILELHVARPY